MASELHALWISNGTTMFRIRESYINEKTVCIWVDGRLSDSDVECFQEILGRYLDLKIRIVVNCAYLTQMGCEGKLFLRKIHDRIVLTDLPQYLKSEIMNKENGDSAE